MLSRPKEIIKETGFKWLVNIGLLSSLCESAFPPQQQTPEGSSLKEGGLILALGFGDLSPQFILVIMSPFWACGSAGQEAMVMVEKQQAFSRVLRGGQTPNYHCYILLSHLSLARNTYYPIYF